MIMLPRRPILPRPRAINQIRRLRQDPCYLCKGTGSVAVVCRDADMGCALERCAVCRGRGYLVSEA